MNVLKARYRDTDAFLEAYSQDIPGGGIFCATTKPLEEDERVLVEVHFPGLPNKLMLKGTVVSWRSALPRLRVRAGANVSFDADEQEKVDFLLAVARGDKKSQPIKRRHARLPVAVDVKWRPANSTEFQRAQLRNISVGGAQLVTDVSLELDAEVVLELTAPGGAQPISIAGKVTNRTDAAYGVRFVYRDGGGSRRLKEVVRRIIAA